MKTHLTGFVAAALCFTLISAEAQPGRPGGMGGMRGMGGPQGAQINAAMTKLFGENQSFSADLENEIKLPRGGSSMTMPGKMAFDSGKARFEMNMTEAKGGAMPPQALAQMKSMGMDNMVSISRPDLKVNYIVYPGLKAYAEMPEHDAGATNAAEFKMETTELGKETVDGHPCVKNKAVVTDDQGKTHESTVWNATDLKNFPIKIETTEQGTGITMSFKNVKLAKPDAALFDPPSDYKKYNNLMEMMQAEVMKRMSEGQGGMPPK